MSKEYDNYILQHKNNVIKGLGWLADHIDFIDPVAITNALGNAASHDESKYSPEEYGPYDAYFYGKNRSYAVVNDFNLAWLHHQHNNPHHWQHWVLVNDDPKDGTVALQMPLETVYEMVADWWSFSWSKGDLTEIFRWYDDHKERMVLHKRTREQVEKILDAMKKELEKENDQAIEDGGGSEYLGHHGIEGMKWGVRNGPPYPLNSETTAKKIYDEAKKNLNDIQDDVTRAAKASGGTMYGLEHALKTPGSIERKLNKKVNEKNMELSEAANDIKDAVRFTVIAPTDSFVDMYKTFSNTLAELGYDETSCDNYFEKYRQGKVKHKAVQSNYKTKNGYEFEVQFQTPESQEAKNKKLPLYNEVRETGISEKRKNEIIHEMEKLAEDVPDPKNIELIRSFKNQ